MCAQNNDTLWICASKMGASMMAREFASTEKTEVGHRNAMSE